MSEFEHQRSRRCLLPLFQVFQEDAMIFSPYLVVGTSDQIVRTQVRKIHVRRVRHYCSWLMIFSDKFHFRYGNFIIDC